MTRLEELEKIILESDNIPEDVILERQYILNDLIGEIDLSEVEELFIESTRKCREKAKKIYECLSEDIKNSKNWCITGKFKIYTETELLSKLFSSSNPYYKKEDFEVFLCSKDDVNEVLYNPDEFKITLMPWNIQVCNELYIFVCLHKFPALDLLGIEKIYTEVIFEYYD